MAARSQEARTPKRHVGAVDERQCQLLRDWRRDRGRSRRQLERQPQFDPSGGGRRQNEGDHKSAGDRDSEEKTRAWPVSAGGSRYGLGSRFRANARTRCRRGGRIKPVEPIEDDQRFLGRRTTIDRGLQQPACLLRFAALKRGDTGLKQLLGFPLPLGLRTSRPLDVRASTCMAPVDEQSPRPHVDGFFVLRGKVMIEADEQELLDLCVAVGADHSIGRAALGALDLRHLARGDYSIREKPNGRMKHMSTFIECVPNVSEGRRGDVIARIADAIRATPGVQLLDHSSDTSHNRSVFTFVGDAGSVERAVLAVFERAVTDIDLRQHRGEHPRLGAVDVVPFVPIEGATMADCVALAKRVGAEVGERFGVPVFLYEEAATRAERRNLEDIRRGEFEGLPTRMSNPEWAPDFGPSSPHPSAGASVIGARMPLIAYNINLATDRLDVAKAIAAAIRHSSGGYRYVKAAGFRLEDRGIVQVSMNLTNFEKTPMFRVFETVKREAERHGVRILESEIVGLVPSSALLAAAQFYLQIGGFKADQVLENRLRSQASGVRRQDASIPKAG